MVTAVVTTPRRIGNSFAPVPREATVVTARVGKESLLVRALGQVYDQMHLFDAMGSHFRGNDGQGPRA